MIPECPTDDQAKHALLYGLKDDVERTMQTIASRGLLWPLYHRGGCLPLGNYDIRMYFRLRRPVTRLTVFLHLDTFRLNYPANYEMEVHVFDVEGYVDAHPFVYYIERGPPGKGWPWPLLRRS
jgi:hypothetical protein